MCLLSLSQNCSAIENIAARNVTSLNKTEVHSLPKIHVYSQDGCSFYKCMTGTSGSYYLSNFSWSWCKGEHDIKTITEYIYIEFRVASQRFLPQVHWQW